MAEIGTVGTDKQSQDKSHCGDKETLLNTGIQVILLITHRCFD